MPLLPPVTTARLPTRLSHDILSSPLLTQRPTPEREERRALPTFPPPAMEFEDLSKDEIEARVRKV